MFAEPCDFNADGYCNAIDIDRIWSALGTENDRLNLDPTTPDISHEDLIAWLADAGVENTNAPYAVGDVDLDGNVNAADLNVLALNWQRAGNVGWADGDLNSDNKVDVADLNELAANWRYGAEAAASTVPEPTTFFMLVHVIISVFLIQRILFGQHLFVVRN